jgi:tetratricopeptide (TPR) repeat protein
VERQARSITTALTALGMALTLSLALIGTFGCSDDENDEHAATTTLTGVTTSNDTGGSPGGASQSPPPPPRPIADYEEALPDLTEKVRESPADPVALQELAIAQYQTQRYEEAASTYAAMLAVDDVAVTHNNLANVLRDWGKIAQARAEYEKAILLDPGLTIAYINLASLNLREGDDAGALDVLERGIAASAEVDRGRLEGLKATIEAQVGG